MNNKTSLGMKSLLQLPVDKLLITLKKLRQKIRPVIYYPYQLEQGFYIIPQLDVNVGSRDDAGFPIPPKELWAGYGQTAEEYLSWGKEDVDKMMEILASSGFAFQDGNRILDFGCAAGRMLRWLASLAEECEIWGLDITAAYVFWCQQNLTPPFNFATITTIPCLPFRDGYFDFIYCGSVFTHIDYLADAWLLELRRVTRPGGKIYITIHDKHTIDLTLNQNRGVPYVKNALLTWDRKKHFLNSKYDSFSMFPGTPNSQVFYDIDRLCKRWERILNVISINQEAYSVQTAILLENSVGIAPKGSYQAQTDTAFRDKVL